MKTLFIFLLMSICGYHALAQCPEAGLLVQSAACESPVNLKVVAAHCPEVILTWQGRQANYLIKATLTDTISGLTTETIIDKYQCDNNGTCRAAITVKAGQRLDWSVQSVCTDGSYKLPSYTVTGPSTIGGYCAPGNEPAAAQLHVYPNPSSGELTVDYPDAGTSQPTFTVMDISGRKTVALTAREITRTGRGYQLHLQQLATGVYILKIVDGAKTSQTKFLIGK